MFALPLAITAAGTPSVAAVPAGTFSDQVTPPGGSTPEDEGEDINEAPVTSDDTFRLLGKGSCCGMDYVDVLVNDSDPDGDPIEVCRFEQPTRPGLVVFKSDRGATDGVFTFGSSRNRTASYEVPYYACDGELETLGMLHVHVKRVPPVVAKVAKRPGRVRFINRSEYRVGVSYNVPGARGGSKPLGSVTLKPGNAAAVKVPGRSITYRAHTTRRGAFAGAGTVRGVHRRR